MKVRTKSTGSPWIALAAGVAIFLALLVPASANAAPTKAFSFAARAAVTPDVVGTTIRPKETMLYHGNSYAIRPSIVTGWIRDGRGDDLQIVGGPTGRPQGNWGSIDWQSWNDRKAVGVGNAWTLCGEAECDAGYPWDGSKVRITAYGTKEGHFTKMKIWAHSAGKLDENYLMKLRFIRPSSVLSWKVTSLDDGREG